MIHIYESPTAPPRRRFIAQFEVDANNRYIVIHGPTAEIAVAKANLHIAYQALPPIDRKAFDLKGQLEAMNNGAIEFPEDDDDFEDLL